MSQKRKEEELEKKEPDVEYDSSDTEASDLYYDADATDEEDDQPTARKRQRCGSKSHNLHSAKVANDEYNPSDEEESSTDPSDDGESSTESSGTEDDD